MDDSGSERSQVGSKCARWPGDIRNVPLLIEPEARTALFSKCTDHLDVTHAQVIVGGYNENATLSWLRNMIFCYISSLESVGSSYGTSGTYGSIFLLIFSE